MGQDIDAINDRCMRYIAWATLERIKDLSKCLMLYRKIQYTRLGTRMSTRLRNQTQKHSNVLNLCLKKYDVYCSGIKNVDRTVYPQLDFNTVTNPDSLFWLSGTVSISLKHDIVDTYVRLKLSREEIIYTRSEMENVVRYFGTKSFRLQRAAEDISKSAEPDLYARGVITLMLQEAARIQRKSKSSAELFMNVDPARYNEILQEALQGSHGGTSFELPQHIDELISHLKACTVIDT